MPQYATVSDYYAFIGVAQPDPIDDDAALKLNADLKRASNEIATALRMARMPLDADGVPTIESQRIARRDATSATVAWWENALGGDATGAASQWDSVSMIGVQFSRRAGTAADRGTASTSRIAPEAMSILRAEFGGSAVFHPGA